MKAADEHSLIGCYDNTKISKEQLLDAFKEYQIDDIMFTYKIKEILKLL